jgi:hypothetical protein
MTPIRAARIAAGYRTAEAALLALAQQMRTKPGRDGCPTLATYRKVESAGPGQLTAQKRRALCRLFGCTDLALTTWPQDMTVPRASADRSEIRPVRNRSRSLVASPRRTSTSISTPPSVRRGRGANASPPPSSEHPTPGGDHAL